MTSGAGEAQSNGGALDLPKRRHPVDLARLVACVAAQDLAQETIKPSTLIAISHRIVQPSGKDAGASPETDRPAKPFRNCWLTEGRTMAFEIVIIAIAVGCAFAISEMMART